MRKLATFSKKSGNFPFICYSLICEKNLTTKIFRDYFASNIASAKAVISVSIITTVITIPK